MKKTDYNIPLFEDTDIADLNKYSQGIADALKTQLDKFGHPLVYKGQVETIEDLPSDVTNGFIYSVISENKNYVWNETEWIEYASTIDFTTVENKITEKGTIVSPTEPTTREKLWLQSTDTEKKLYTKNEDGTYEEFFDGNTLGIETITNENGTAIKFPDGTLICMCITSIKCGSNGAGTFTFPVSFIDGNIGINATPCYSSANTIWGLFLTIQRSATGGAIYFRKVENGQIVTVTDSNAGAFYTAIGRWK